jgi:hypothetical protein
MPGQVAAAVIGLQALGCVLAVGFALKAPREASLGTSSQVMFGVFTFVFAVGLALLARALWRGLTWPRTAAVVWLVLLLPVGWAIVQASGGLFGALILASAVVGIVAVAAESRASGMHPDA